MKVGTDGILLGGWTPLPAPAVTMPWRLVDVGTGTGLLALMLAQRLLQRNPQALFRIDALEPAPAAAEQAHTNVQQSPWSTQIWVYPKTLQDYAEQRLQTEASRAIEIAQDMLWVSNPPFFESHQRLSGDPARALARHESPDFCAQLFHYARLFLHPRGQLVVIVPVERVADYIAQARSAGFSLQRRCRVRHSREHPVKRVLLCWGQVSIVFPQRDEDLCLKVRDAQGKWQDTAAYTAYVRDFYLRYAES